MPTSIYSLRYLHFFKEISFVAPFLHSLEIFCPVCNFYGLVLRDMPLVHHLLRDVWNVRALNQPWDEVAQDLFMVLFQVPIVSSFVYHLFKKLLGNFHLRVLIFDLRYHGLNIWVKISLKMGEQRMDFFLCKIKDFLCINELLKGLVGVNNVEHANERA